jgi:hypothetical protein
MTGTDRLSLADPQLDWMLAEAETRDPLAGLDGEVQAAVDWVDQAFGEIDAAFPRLRPMQGLSAALRRALRLR